MLDIISYLVYLDIPSCTVRKKVMKHNEASFLIPLSDYERILTEAAQNLRRFSRSRNNMINEQRRDKPTDKEEINQRYQLHLYTAPFKLKNDRTNQHIFPALLNSTCKLSAITRRRAHNRSCYTVIFSYFAFLSISEFLLHLQRGNGMLSNTFQTRNRLLSDVQKRKITRWWLDKMFIQEGAITMK